MPTIEKIANDLRDSIPSFSEVSTVNDRIAWIRDLVNYKSVVFLLRNSDFAKNYLEEVFFENKTEKDQDMFLFSIILAFIDICDFKHSCKLAKEFSNGVSLHWSGALAKSHLLYLSLYSDELMEE